MKPSQNAQQEGHGIYRTVFEKCHVAMLFLDSQGRIMDISEAGVELLGFENKEGALALSSLGELFEDPGDFGRFQDRTCRNGFIREIEVGLKGKTGRRFPAQISSFTVVDKNNQGISTAVLIQDVAERKQVEQELEEHNKRLSILNNISMAISKSLDLESLLHTAVDEIIEVLAPDSVRIYLLDDTKKVLQLAAYKGYSERFINKSYYQSRKIGNGLLGETAQTGETLVISDLELSKSPYVDSLIEEGLQSTVYIPLVCRGEVLGVMPVSSHSEMRFSKDQIEFLSAIGNQIGVAVHNAHLYEDLKKAYEELKLAQEQITRAEKLASLGKLAATIAHEINNPLGAVLTYTRLMRKMAQKEGGFPKERTDDILRYLETMGSETARCGEIVKNLLSFARRSSISIGPCNIEAIIDKTLLLIGHELDMKAIRVRRHIEPNLPDVQCDFKQIQQAILNLLSNAGEAMAKGGTLTVEARRAEQGDRLEVIVADTGCGIPQENLENIFEPFFTTKEEGKGVGLGLSVAYGIITKHKGSIDVTSTQGKGSTFRILLPFSL